MLKPQPSSQAKPCAFCRQPGASTEHVFASWTSDIVPGDGVFTTSGTGRRRTKQSKGLSVISRAPCVACNTGWMSQLEQRAKPLLTPAIQGDQTRWAPAERETIAVWATKTALMADRADPNHYVPDDHFHHLYDTGEPHPSTRVWVTSLVYPPGRSFLEAAILHRKGLLIESASLTTHGYRITLAIGYLAVQVFGAANAPELTVERTLEINGVRIQDFLRQLWPHGDETLTWPPAAAFDASALELLA